ncbi:MAG: sulfatase-like hydrolase/transferase [Clostridia bacterium]|nr:sulfatase-like hydrolase/transferase [Clostridia bacterium]
MNRLPNIVFILTDDQGAWAIGRETPEIVTPHIDRLAGEGVYFRNAFCASPVCSPARCSIVTGRLPSAHGVHDWLRGGNVDTGALPPAMRPFLPDERRAVDYLEGMPTVFDALRAAGYHMALVGKWHMGDSMRPREGFEEWTALLRGGCPYRRADVFADGEARFIDQYVTDFFTDRAVRYIDSRPAGPFLLSLHYTAPHTPWNHEQHREDMLRLYDDCPFACHPLQPVHPDQVGNIDVGDTDERRRYLLKGYYAAISAVDEGVGRVMEALRRNGLDKNTLVVFAGDNGMNLGQHGVWGKGNGTYPMNMYDSSVKVPFIVWGPGLVRQGAVVDNLVSHYDILPTLRAFLGQPTGADEKLPGESFLQELTEGRPPVDRRLCVLDEYGPVRMIRSRTHKLVYEGIRGGHQLYDLTADPGETVNRYGDPAYAAARRSLMAELERAFTEYALAPFGGAKTAPTGSGQLGPITREGEDVFHPEIVLFREKQD